MYDSLWNTPVLFSSSFDLSCRPRLSSSPRRVLLGHRRLTRLPMMLARYSLMPLSPASKRDGSPLEILLRWRSRPGVLSMGLPHYSCTVPSADEGKGCGPWTMQANLQRSSHGHSHGGCSRGKGCLRQGSRNVASRLCASLRHMFFQALRA